METAHKSEPWEEILCASESDKGDDERPMRLLRRGGRAFLLLPKNGRLGALGLSLYAPQTKKARWMKGLLGSALRTGVAVRFEAKSIRWSDSDPFTTFLAQTAGTSRPEFALLAGNPETKGQRCIFLLFNAHGAPAAVVKAGFGVEATRLIDHEEAFLKSSNSNASGIPALRSSFRSDRVHAFGMDFIPGASPRAGDYAPALQILSDWINTNRLVTVRELPVWHRLSEAAGAGIAPSLREFGDATVCPVIYHGDFAPWNIRVHSRKWTLLDWERGERTGMPLWDLLHFIIQPAILVKRESPLAILARVGELLQTPPFVSYLERARIRGLEGHLLLAYLDYCIHVLKPTEGLEQTRILSDLALSSGRFSSILND